MRKHFLSLLNIFLCAHAITVYYVPGQEPLSLKATSTTTSSLTESTGKASSDTLVLNAPALPNPPPPTTFAMQLQSGANPPFISIPIPSNFYGFSIEFSVINAVIGRSAARLQVPFLNLLANIVKRSGGVQIRVGGNTQEIASMVDSLPNNVILEKDHENCDINTPTCTPPTVFTAEALYMLANVSSLVKAKWYLGIPFNDTNWRLQIATEGLRILGDNLLGLQAGNEPDQYDQHGARPAGGSYTPQVYLGEFKSLVAAISAPGIDPALKTMLIGPSLSGVFWKNQDVWDTGYIDVLHDNLKYLSTEVYPDNNCAAIYPKPGVPAKNPQDVLPNYSNHKSVTDLVAVYKADTALALSKGKPFIMFETNTASCSGFPGISDAFVSALWALDYGFSMAANNFSGALLHVGGQSALYNPFTPPPANESSFEEFTVGPVYYSALIMAEGLGSSSTTQVWDMGLNDGNVETPGYAMYQKGNPIRLGLFNYMTDPTGASTYTASISVKNVNQADNTPTQVKVKYLKADSITQKNDITWAGQTLGNSFESDGRIQGDEDVQTVTCNNGVCQIVVPAPSFAMVFLSDEALTDGDGGALTTYATTSTKTVTNTLNTATIDPAVLATSNGHKGLDAIQLGSTSSGSAQANGVGKSIPVIMGGSALFAAFISGVLLIGGQS